MFAWDSGDAIAATKSAFESACETLLLQSGLMCGLVGNVQSLFSFLT